MPAKCPVVVFVVACAAFAVCVTGCAAGEANEYTECETSSGAGAYASIDEYREDIAADLSRTLECSVSGYEQEIDEDGFWATTILLACTEDGVVVTPDQDLRVLTTAEMTLGLEIDQSVVFSYDYHRGSSYEGSPTWWFRLATANGAHILSGVDVRASTDSTYESISALPYPITVSDGLCESNPGGCGAAERHALEWQLADEVVRVFDGNHASLGDDADTQVWVTRAYRVDAGSSCSSQGEWNALQVVAASANPN